MVGRLTTIRREEPVLSPGWSKRIKGCAVIGTFHCDDAFVAPSGRNVIPRNGNRVLFVHKSTALLWAAAAGNAQSSSSLFAKYLV
jgi:hypothetical protein